jgi:hypothetical protein
MHCALSGRLSPSSGNALSKAPDSALDNILDLPVFRFYWIDSRACFRGKPRGAAPHRMQGEKGKVRRMAAVVSSAGRAKGENPQ